MAERFWRCYSVSCMWRKGPLVLDSISGLSNQFVRSARRILRSWSSGIELFR